MISMSRTTGSAHAVVLLHSSGNSSRQWTDLIEGLRPRHAVHAPDFHGHGRRRPWDRAAPITLADEVALIAPVLESGRPVHLVGHSIGGAVALKAATLYPNAVVSVVVYEPVLFRWQLDDDAESDASRAVLDVVRRMRACLDRGNAYRAAAIFLEYWSGRGAWEVVPASARDVLAGRMRHVLGHFDALFSDRLSPIDLKRVACPMLFLSGERTVASTRRIAGLLREQLPRAAHEVMRGMDHLGPVKRAAEFNERVLSFIADVDTPQPRVGRLPRRTGNSTLHVEFADAS